jgi:hypothetical protein
MPIFQFSQNDEYVQRLCISLFWFHYLQKKNLESVCVLCARNVHSKKAVVCCKVQTLDCALAFVNPNS